jgi:ribosome-associated protein
MFITLAQAVKLAGLAETGGQAKGIVRTGMFRVNGEAEHRPGRKLHAGDVIQQHPSGQEWIIQE